MDKLPRTRILRTSGIRNFRDFGGYHTRGGGQIVTGHLYRSGDHANASESDLELVDTLNLKAIFDLRGPRERQRAPCRRPREFAVPVYTIKQETAIQLRSADSGAIAGDKDDRRHEASLYFARMPYLPHVITIYRKCFDALADSAGPVLMYCDDGTYRTGLLVAIIQSVLGMHMDDIFEDYLLSARFSHAPARAQEEMDYSMRTDSVPLCMDLGAAGRLDPRSLEIAFDSIRDNHGGIDLYCREVLGMTWLLKDRLVGRLIA